MADLAVLIQQAINAKQGDREFALSFDGESHWCAQIGNTSNCVALGETVGEFCVEGDTPEAAMIALLAALRE